MYLQNGHRLTIYILLCTCLHPLLICPHKMVDICHYRRCAGAQFCFVGIRISFVIHLSVRTLDQIFIHIPQFNTRNKQLIDTALRRFEPLHLMLRLIPVIKCTDDPHTLCPRCPQIKHHTLFPLDRHAVCTEFFINVVVRRLSEQIHVQFCKIPHRFAPLYYQLLLIPQNPSHEVLHNYFHRSAWK